MNGTYSTSKISYPLPVPEDIQKAIIEQMWPMELEIALRHVLNFPDKDHLDEKKNVAVDEQYFTSSAEKHWKYRKELLSGGWKTNGLDNRPPYIHVIPQYGDSDVVQTLRGWEILKVTKEQLGKFALGDAEVFIPKSDKYPELVAACTKIVVSVGQFNSGYAVLAIPENKKITPRLKVTLNAAGMRGMNTEYYSLNQIRKNTERYWRQVPPDISEGLLKTLAVAKEILDYVPDVELPELYMPDTSSAAVGPYPLPIVSYFFDEHIPQEFSKLETDEDKEKFDFGNALLALLRMEQGKLPEDNFTKHIMYGYLSEPGNVKKLQTKMYGGMKKIIDKLDVVSPYCDINTEDVGVKLTPQEIDEIYKTARTIHPFILVDNLYLPPYMHITLGEEKTRTILDSFALKENHIIHGMKGDLLNHYKSNDNRLRVSLLYGVVDTDNGPVDLQNFWLKKYDKHLISIQRIVRHKQRDLDNAEIVANP